MTVDSAAVVLYVRQINMNIDRKTIYTVAGISMIVGSLFAASKALGGIIFVIYATVMTSNNSGQHDSAASAAESMLSLFYSSSIGGGISSVGSFIILFLGGKWMLKGPRMIDRWLDDSENKA